MNKTRKKKIVQKDQNKRLASQLITQTECCICKLITTKTELQNLSRNEKLNDKERLYYQKQGYKFENSIYYICKSCKKAVEEEKIESVQIKTSFKDIKLNLMKFRKDIDKLLENYSRILQLNIQIEGKITTFKDLDKEIYHYNISREFSNISKKNYNIHKIGSKLKSYTLGSIRNKYLNQSKWTLAESYNNLVINASLTSKQMKYLIPLINKSPCFNNLQKFISKKRDEFKKSLIAINDVKDEDIHGFIIKPDSLSDYDLQKILLGCYDFTSKCQKEDEIPEVNIFKIIKEENDKITISIKPLVDIALDGHLSHKFHSEIVITRNYSLNNIFNRKNCNSTLGIVQSSETKKNISLFTPSLEKYINSLEILEFEKPFKFLPQEIQQYLHQQLPNYNFTKIKIILDSILGQNGDFKYLASQVSKIVFYL